jgi:hypothetical protein
MTPLLVLVYFVSVSINAANTLLAEVGIGFAIAVAVIILALTINMVLDDICFWRKLPCKKGKKAHPSPPGGGGGRNVHESKARPDDGTENPPRGPSGTSMTVKENRGLFPTKPRLIGRARQRNGPSDEENGTV